jgi:hypothetical protein
VYVPLESCNDACIETAFGCVESGKEGFMEKDDQEVELEDGIFEEIAEEEETETTLDAALLDEAEDEFVQGSVDPEDLATGFSATIPTREIDVDEDTQGDEVPDPGGEEPLARFEVAGELNRVRGDEIELDLDEVLATGRTVAEAPDVGD